jgi:hypothetical protein
MCQSLSDTSHRDYENSYQPCLLPCGFEPNRPYDDGFGVGPTSPPRSGQHVIPECVLVNGKGHRPESAAPRTLRLVGIPPCPELLGVAM